MSKRRLGLGDPVLIGLGLLVTAGALFVHTYAGPAGTFWTIDNGGKTLVIANLQEDASRTWLAYPGREIDPELRLFPQPLSGPEPYGTVRGGNVVSQYLSPFAWLVLPGATLLGFVGLGLLPAVAGGATVYLTGLLGGRLAAGIAALASPLLFYSAVLWEHTLVVALAAAAFLLSGAPRRRHSFTAGLLLGLACMFREEVVLLLVGGGLAILSTRERRSKAIPFAAGGAVGVFFLLLVNQLATGSILGIHVGLNQPVPLRHTVKAVEGLILGSGFSGSPALVTVAALALLAAAPLIRRRESLASAGDVLFAAAGCALFAVSALAWARFPGGEDRALALIRSNSLLVALPWVLLLPFSSMEREQVEAGGKRPGTGDPLSIAGRGVVLFLILFVLSCPERSITGVHPGPRMLLPALPVFAAIAAAQVRRAFRGQRGVGGAGERTPSRFLRLAPLFLLFAIGIAWNVRSLELLAGKRAVAGAIASRLGAAVSEEHAGADETQTSGAPRLPIAATDLFWLPTEMATLWDRIEFHLIRGPGDLQELSRRAAARGARRLTLVTAPGSVRGEAPVARIRDPGFPAFSVDVHVQPVEPVTPPPGDSPRARLER